jgi:tRNA 2-thiouridine synthesizing protein A
MSGPLGPVVIDGGDRSCVRLLLELRDHAARHPPGTVIHLLASDPAAPLDLAAWCHLVGHDYLGPLPVTGGTPGYALCTGARPRLTAPASPWRPSS